MPPTPGHGRACHLNPCQARYLVCSSPDLDLWQWPLGSHALVNSIRNPQRRSSQGTGRGVRVGTNEARHDGQAALVPAAGHLVRWHGCRHRTKSLLVSTLPANCWQQRQVVGLNAMQVACDDKYAGTNTNFCLYFPDLQNQQFSTKTQHCSATLHVLAKATIDTSTHQKDKVPHLV